MANKPNNPSLWSKAKSLAKQKFDVYPSAYANVWAAKWYKNKGGTWRKAEYGKKPKAMKKGGEPDGEMALGQISAAIDKLEKLRQFIQPESDLEPWVSSKITLMDHFTDAVSDYMMYNPEAQELEEMKGGGQKAYYDDGLDAWVYDDGTVGPNGPAYMKEGGYYMGYDGKRHKATTPTWSGNEGYEMGGLILPEAAYGGYCFECGGSYADGGIHINPANKGKFTASANAAGMGVQEFAAHVLANKEDYSSTQVKRANFARNAAKWKKQFGGSADPLNDCPEGYAKDQFGNCVPKDELGGFDPSQLQKKGMPIVPVMNSKGQMVGGPNANVTPLSWPTTPKGPSWRQKLNNFNEDMAKTVLGLNVFADAFITNPQIKRQNEELARKAGMADTLNYTAPEDRGDWVNTGARLGELRPNQYVVNKGMYTGQFLPKSQMGGESVIPEMLIPTYTSPIGSYRAVADATYVAHSPAVNKETSVKFNLTKDFQDYARKADEYIKKVNPNADISGAMLAAGAQQAYEQFGKVVPVELALAQLQQEGYLAKTRTPNKPQRTKNPFNVGNTDDGSVKTHANVQSGVNAYYDLLASSYLSARTPEQLLTNFVNARGNRYASDRGYEKALTKIIQGMGSRSFEQGGVYELSQEEINEIVANGGSVEFV